MTRNLNNVMDRAHFEQLGLKSRMVTDSYAEFVAEVK